MLDHPSLAAQIAPGLIAINDDFRHRVVIVSVRTHRIVWQYGHTDIAGRAPGYLNTPDGFDLLKTADAQRVPAVRALLTARTPVQRSSPARAATNPAVHVRLEPFRLPAPVERAVAAGSPSGILIAGGLDAGGASTSGVFRLDPASGRLTRLGSVPQAFHDAAGGVIGGKLFIFGGGSSTSSAAVQAFDPATRQGRVVAQLPRPLSDLASATIGATVYLVGGYDGRTARTEIYATTDGTHFRLAGRLPAGVRYPAVAAIGGRLVIAGGNLSTGAPSTNVYAFDPGSGRARRLGSLATALGHASAVTVGAAVFILGGIDAAGAPVSTASRIDAAAGTIAAVPVNVPVADAASAELNGRTFLVGGRRGTQAVADVRAVGP
jgi:hypothetical protein